LPFEQVSRHALRSADPIAAENCCLDADALAVMHHGIMQVQVAGAVLLKMILTKARDVI
jgi:hypothetical protein